MVPTADRFRYLGVQYSPSLDHDVSAGAISDIFDDILSRITAVPVGGGKTRFLAEQIMWAKVGCRLRFERSTPGGFRWLQGELRSLLLYRAKLRATMNKVAAAISAELGGSGVSSLRDFAMGVVCTWCNYISTSGRLPRPSMGPIKAAVAR